MSTEVPVKQLSIEPQVHMTQGNQLNELVDGLSHTALPSTFKQNHQGTIFI